MTNWTRKSRQTPTTALLKAAATFLLLLLLIAGNVPPSEGLDCVVCGEYNDDGTGAITPCLNYSAALIPRLRKKCPRPEHKFCIKYVSELSVVRDCVEECKEKEVWDTQTFCCNEDVCNAAGRPSTAGDALHMLVAICTAISVAWFGGGGLVRLAGFGGPQPQQPQHVQHLHPNSVRQF